MSVLKNILAGVAADMLAMVYAALALGSGRYEREVWLIGAVLLIIVSAALMQSPEPKNCHQRFISSAAAFPVTAFVCSRTGLLLAFVDLNRRLGKLDNTDLIDHFLGLYVILIPTAAASLLLGAGAAAVISRVREVRRRNAQRR
ncbi:MAG: hypothetical protein IJ723_03675 [Ruminococcus sp.]|nr:hypothetical protein [Ruminococcus sp.]